MSKPTAAAQRAANAMFFTEADKQRAAEIIDAAFSDFGDNNERRDILYATRDALGEFMDGSHVDGVPKAVSLLVARYNDAKAQLSTMVREQQKFADVFAALVDAERTIAALIVGETSQLVRKSAELKLAKVRAAMSKIHGGK